MFCRLFHFKRYWEIYNTWYGKAPFRAIRCKKCGRYYSIKLGEEEK